MWDSIAQRYFKSEHDYLRALELLQRYVHLSTTALGSLEAAQEEFFDELDDTTNYESYLLEQAIKHHIANQLANGIQPKIPQFINALEKIDVKKSALSSKKISIAVDEFLKVKNSKWKKHSSQEKAFKNQFAPFIISITGDIDTGELTKSMIAEVGAIILNYPKNKNKISKYKNYSTRDFLTIEVPQQDKIAANTINKYKTQIGSFLKWLKRNDLTHIDLDAPLDEIGVKKAAPSEQRNAYKCGDLEKLFNSKQYITGRHKLASHFWVPLIGLFSGARENEICQLTIADLQFNVESNRWVFDFNEEDDTHGKSIKNGRKRLFPIHRRLIDLGILEYHELMKNVKNPEKRLFPELKYVRDEGKYAERLQKWFNTTYTNRSNCDIKTPKTSFHSLRHTYMEQMLVKHKIPSNSFIGGLGQTPQGNEAETRYSKQDRYMNYKDYFDLISFDDCIDFSKIRNWKHHIFYSKLK